MAPARLTSVPNTGMMAMPSGVTRFTPRRWPSPFTTAGAGRSSRLEIPNMPGAGASMPMRGPMTARIASSFAWPITSGVSSTRLAICGSMVMPASSSRSWVRSPRRRVPVRPVLAAHRTRRRAERRRCALPAPSRSHHRPAAEPRARDIGQKIGVLRIRLVVLKPHHRVRLARVDHIDRDPQLAQLARQTARQPASQPDSQTARQPDSQTARQHHGLPARWRWRQCEQVPSDRRLTHRVRQFSTR